MDEFCRLTRSSSALSSTSCEDFSPSWSAISLLLLRAVLSWIRRSCIDCSLSINCTRPHTYNTTTTFRIKSSSKPACLMSWSRQLFQFVLCGHRTSRCWTSQEHKLVRPLVFSQSRLCTLRIHYHLTLNPAVLWTTSNDTSIQTVLTWCHQRLSIFGLYGAIQMLSLLLLFIITKKRKYTNKWTSMLHHCNVCLCPCRLIYLLITMTFDLWPWKPLHQCPLTRWIFVASFVEIRPLRKKILSHVKYVLTDGQKTYDR